MRLVSQGRRVESKSSTEKIVELPEKKRSPMIAVTVLESRRLEQSNNNLLPSIQLYVHLHVYAIGCVCLPEVGAGVRVFRRPCH